MNDEGKIVRECAAYFKNTSGFKRILEKIKEKYESLGSIGGTIVLSNLKKEEQEALTGFFRKDYYSNKSASIKVENFIKALDSTKFSGVSFEKVLNAYFGKRLLSKKEQKSIYEAEKEKYFHEIKENFRESRGERWLSFIFEKKENAYKIIVQKYDDNKEQLKAELIAVCTGYNNLSFDVNNTTRLALFASNITKNPHSFDENTYCGKLLVYAICYELNINYPSNAEELNEALYKAGIIKDEVSNFTLCSGLIAYIGEKEHKGWKGFYEANEPLQVSLWNISKLSKIVSPRNKVFVFENPTVFSEVLYKVLELSPSLVCTFGNFKLASLILLDKLYESGALIYYCGDFDPEGIIMAEKLKKRYKQSLVLWRYESKDYLTIKSGIKLSESRLKKLDNIESTELKAIAQLIKLHKSAGYQEMMTEKYVDDIRNWNSSTKNTAFA